MTDLADTLIYLLFWIVPILLALILRTYLLHHRGQPRTMRRLLAGNGLVFLLVAALLALAGESYFRFGADFTDSYGLSRVTTRWNQRHYQANNWNFRDTEDYQLAIHPGMRRITFLGDSFTAGHGVENPEERFPNRLRQRLLGVEVHVLARYSANTGEYIRLLEEAKRTGYQVDLVVMAYCLNDLGDLYAPWTETMDRMNQNHRHANLLVEKSYLASFLVNRLAGLVNPMVRNYFGLLGEAYATETWDAQKQRLLQVQALVESAGGQLLVVTFPFLHQPLDDSYPFAEVHAQLDQFWQDHQVRHLDLRETYRPYAPEDLVVNAYDAHPNAFAHALAGDALEPLLREVLNQK